MADTKVPVRRIAPGVSGNPKPLGPNDPRNEAQFWGEQRSDDQYVSPATIDNPPSPRGYAKGGKVVGCFSAGGKVLSCRKC